MKQKENIFKNAPFGYALHRIILDEAGKPVDYEFIEVNKSFENLTGLVKAEIIGKKVTEAIPGIENGDFDWIGFYGTVALEETEESFEQYSEPLGKHYQVQAYSPQKEYFITLFSDVTVQKRFSEIAAKFNNFNAESFDYKYIVDKAREISGAKYAILNKFDENGRDFSTVGFSGINKHLKKVASLLGFDVIGKKWAYDPDRQKKIEVSQITVFEKLIDLAGNIISNNTINVLCKTFNIGKTAVVKILKDGKMLADFTLIFSKNEGLNNQDMIKTYADMTGMLINRIDSEKKTIENEQRLDMLISSTPAVIYAYQFVGNKMEITYINENIKNIIGFSPEDFIGHEDLHLSCVHPDDKKYMLDELMQLIQGEKDTAFLNYRFKDKNGNYRWLADTHKVISRSEEKVECIGSWWDTTKEKESQIETEKLKEQFELAIAGTNDGIWDWNLKTNELFLSKRWKEMLGYEESEIKNEFNSFISLIYEEDIPKVNDFVERYLKGVIENYAIEFRMKHKDGTLRWILAKGEALRNEKGIPYRMAGSHSDITERKELEAEFKENQERLELAMDAGEHGFWDWDLITNNTYFSSTYYTMLGYDDKELPMNFDTFNKLIHPDDAKNVMPEMQSSIENGKPYEAEFRLKCKDGSYKWIMGKGKTYFDDDSGKPNRAIGVHIDINERKLAEKKLRESEIRFNAAVEGTEAGIWDWDMINNTVTFSKQWKTMLGYKENEVENSFNGWKNLWHPDDVERIEKAVNDHLEGKTEKYQIVNRLKHKDGSWRWIMTRGKLLRDDHNEPYRWVGTNIDITSQKEAERKLKESETNFRTFFETMDDMIMIGNKQGEIFYTNPAVTEKLGYSTDELTGMHVLDVHPETKRKEAEQIFGEMFAGQRDTCPLPLAAKDGSFVPVETRVWFGKWDGKDSIFGISKDLSAQQEALQKFNKLFNSNPALMAVSELPSREFTEVNIAFTQTLGYKKEEIVGNTAADLDLFVETEKQEQVGDALQKNGKTHNIELKVKAKNGSIITGLFSGEIIESQGKQYLLTVITDITALKKVQEELKETNKSLEETTAKATSMAAEAKMANTAKSEFLANMSHEIRTPMNSVIGFSELLQGTDLNKIQKQYVDTIASSGKGLLGIINDILDFSKIEAGKLDLEIIQTDLIDMIEQTVDLIKYPASKKRIELLLNIDPDLPRFAMVDPVRLRQILANLLSNALKFTEKGEIELKASLQKLEDNRGQIKFLVRDTGIGISDAQKEKLFKAFSQADSSTTRKFGGTGLGLVISDQLAQKMGGKLEVDSVQGEGTEFYFTIETELKEGDKLKEADISKIKRCLVIDDNENNRTIMEHLLAKWEIECITCDNGFESLKVIEQSKAFDVIICDYHMPYLDGLETVKMIRGKLELTPEKQPIILLHSSSDDAELQNKCKELGIYFRLTKPVKQDELLNCFANIQRGSFEEEINTKTKTEAEENKIIAENTDNESHTILIAEDNANNMLFITTLINQILPGVKIIEAGNGKEAVEKIINLRPNLVFMDVQMPEMDGNEATAQLRKHETEEKLSHTIVVGLTAGALKQEKDKSLESGMDDFLTKPVETDKLKAVLNKYLKREKTQEGNVQENNKSADDANPSISRKDHFDREELFEMMSRNRSVLNELISFFIEDTKNIISEFEVLLESKSFEEAAKVAHSMKGSSANMRCNTFLDLIKKIEREILEEDSDAAGNTLQQIKNEWEILLPILKQSISG